MALLTKELLSCFEMCRIHITALQKELERAKRHIEEEDRVSQSEPVIKVMAQQLQCPCTSAENLALQVRFREIALVGTNDPNRFEEWVTTMWVCDECARREQL